VELLEGGEVEEDSSSLPYRGGGVKRGVHKEEASFYTGRGSNRNRRGREISFTLRGGRKRRGTQFFL